MRQVEGDKAAGQDSYTHSGIPIRWGVEGGGLLSGVEELVNVKHPCGENL